MVLGALPGEIPECTVRSNPYALPGMIKKKKEKRKTVGKSISSNSWFELFVVMFNLGLLQGFVWERH